MEQDASEKLQQLIDLLREKEERRKDFQDRLLEELRSLNRTLSTMAGRQTLGDL